MARKAQLWSMDFVMSMLIFITAVVSVVFAWNVISANTIETQEMKELQFKALTLSDSLIRTPGVPVDWNQTNVEVFGLAINENILNVTKIRYFVNMSDNEYDRVKGLLDIGFYDFYIELEDLNGTIIENTSNTFSNSTYFIIPIERYTLYNDRIVKFKFIIWES